MKKVLQAARNPKRKTRPHTADPELPGTPNICETCTKCFTDILGLEKVDRYFGSRNLIYHADFHHLEQSAGLGCGLCRLIYQSMVLEVGKYEYRKSPGPLSFSKEPILLTQTQFSSNFSVCVCVGNFELELLDVPTPSELTSKSGPRSRTQEPKPIQVENILALDQNTRPIFDMIQEWLEGCCYKHQLCADVAFKTSSHEDATDLRLERGADESSSLFLPKRLLAISGSCAQPNIELVLSSNIVDTRTHSSENPDPIQHRPRYTTLSYKWGEQHAWGGEMAHVITTPSNYSSHLTSIDFITLPATFRHAIWTTLRLGIHYIWIDALCIIQPTSTDSVDWDKEASTMCDIYMNSTLNIAATGSQSVFDGLFSERNAMRYAVSPVRVDHLSKVYTKARFPLWINPRPADFVALVEDSPLATRGWVMQERFLAPRTVHFAKQCVFWSCRTQTASEYNRAGKPMDEHDTSGFEWLNWSHLLRDGFTLEAWRRVVERYSRLQLTQATDRLPAVAGLADLWSRASSDRYLAGIWRGDIMQSLSWKAEIIEIEWASVREKYGRIVGTPSWSWASIGAEVEFLSTMIRDVTWLVDILEVSVKPNNKENLLGQALGGSLKVKGALKTFRFSRTDMLMTRDYKMSMVEGNEGCTDEGDLVSYVFRLYLDEPAVCMDVLEKGEQSFSVSCLRLGVSRTPHEREQHEFKGSHEQIYLALTPVEGGSGTQYRRIGRLDRNVNCHAEENSDACTDLDSDGDFVEIEIT